MQNTERRDISTRIAAKIVASLKAGARPWIKPWSGGRDHAPDAPQRRALFRHQHPDAVGVGSRAGLRLAKLDDLQAGAVLENPMRRVAAESLSRRSVDRFKLV